MSILFIFVFLTIQPGQLHRASSSRVGSITRASTKRLLLFDAAYEAYISEPDIPHSIFEIPGARECAIELRSFSKNGGFTGVRCGFTVMPKSVLARTENGRRFPLHPLWQRRWSTKSNSVSYPVQRGAEALYSHEGRKQMSRARSIITWETQRFFATPPRALVSTVFGGVNAPYIWVKTPDGLTSWQMFDRMLRELNVVITPGAGFGAQGDRLCSHFGVQQPRKRGGSSARVARSCSRFRSSRGHISCKI